VLLAEWKQVSLTLQSQMMHPTTPLRQRTRPRKRRSSQDECIGHIVKAIVLSPVIVLVLWTGVWVLGGTRATVLKNTRRSSMRSRQQQQQQQQQPPSKVNHKDIPLIAPLGAAAQNNVIVQPPQFQTAEQAARMMQQQQMQQGMPLQQLPFQQMPMQQMQQAPPPAGGAQPTTGALPLILPPMPLGQGYQQAQLPVGIPQGYQQAQMVQQQQQQQGMQLPSALLGGPPQQPPLASLPMQQQQAQLQQQQQPPQHYYYYYKPSDTTRDANGNLVLPKMVYDTQGHAVLVETLTRAAAPLRGVHHFENTTTITNFTYAHPDTVETPVHGREPAKGTVLLLEDLQEVSDLSELHVYILSAGTLALLLGAVGARRFRNLDTCLVSQHEVDEEEIVYSAESEAGTYSTFSWKGDLEKFDV